MHLLKLYNIPVQSPTVATAHLSIPENKYMDCNVHLVDVHIFSLIFTNCHVVLSANQDLCHGASLFASSAHLFSCPKKGLCQHDQPFTSDPVQEHNQSDSPLSFQ